MRRVNIGQHVQLHPDSDSYQHGYKHGLVTGYGPRMLYLAASGREVMRRTVKVSLANGKSVYVNPVTVKVVK